MPSPKRSASKSPSKSPNKSPKKSPKGKGARLGPDALRELGQRLYPREQYSHMGTIFKKVGPKIGLYVNKLHVYELWNLMPEVQQYSNSNKSGSPKGSRKSSPKRSPSPKKSPKGSPKGKAAGAAQPDPNMPDYEPARLSGVVVVRKDCIADGMQVFIEACADFVYSAQSKVPPFPDQVATQCRCYREVKVINTLQFSEDYSDDHSQALFTKIKTSFRKGRSFPFTFDLTRKPDSIYFRRPYNYTEDSGLFWSLRAYVSNAENCDPDPDLQMSMEFFKFTAAPLYASLVPRHGNPVQSVRHSTMDDVGDLVLQAELDQQIYYNGQDVKVKVKVENGSGRHVVHSLAVFVEQTCRLNHQLPQDITTPIGELVLAAGDPGLPINPKQRQWTKDVVLKPTIDPTKYNLVTDGRMPVDGKVFLASSSIVMISKPVPPPEPLPEDGAGEGAKAKKSPGGKKSPKTKSSPDKSPKKSPAKSPRSKSPKSKASPKKSPGKGGKAAPPVAPKPEEEEEEKIKEVHTMTSKQDCRPALIFYNVVVRLDLKTVSGDEAGHPSVRVPFILTRESRYLDKLSNPPTWTVIPKH